MTSGSDLTRRGARAGGPAPQRARPARARWTRRRGVVSVLAGAAAVGMAIGTLAPLGSSLAIAQSNAPEAISQWASSRGDAQQFAVDGVVAEPASLPARGGYTVYVTPKPTPTPTPTPSQGRSSGAPAAVYYTGGGSSSEWLSAAGIPESDWGFVDYIVSRESGWNPNATNKSSGACGLVQAYPCSKVPGSGYNPVDNLRWANGYAVGRYGSWAEAHSFWTNNHWW